MDNIVISNTKDFEIKLKEIASQGKDKLHVIADFDGTLSKEFVDGKKIPALIAHIRDGSYLTPDYAEKAHALYNKYHPIEIDLSIPLEERKRKMLEWWSSHYKLLIKCGLNKKDVERLISEDKIMLREGIDKFLQILHKNNIPLIILSSSGLGDAIPLVFSKNKILYSNIHIISNQFVWDKEGRALKIKEPIIHSLNKKEIEIKDFQVSNEIKNRKNIILLGNSVGDIEMTGGFHYDNIIKIGFLNDEKEISLDEFKRHYDIVLLGDPGMDYVIELIKRIIE